MEAAWRGHTDVGRVLLDMGADISATLILSTRDTALAIAAEKGHFEFVDLLLMRGACVEVKNKKGNTPLWLACNGGHMQAIRVLINCNADVDSQDNRKLSCLMTAFQNGHHMVIRFS